MKSLSTCSRVLPMSAARTSARLRSSSMKVPWDDGSTPVRSAAPIHRLACTCGPVMPSSSPTSLMYFSKAAYSLSLGFSAQTPGSSA